MVRDVEVLPGQSQGLKKIYPLLALRLEFSQTLDKSTLCLGLGRVVVVFFGGSADSNLVERVLPTKRGLFLVALRESR